MSVLTIQLCCGSLRADIRGPVDLPTQLPGLWKVSLCASHTHNWIRFEHVETGEVHTLGRYVRGFGGVIDWRSCRKVWPHAPASGLIWDLDLKHDHGLRRGRILRSCYVRNPLVFRGRGTGPGHCIIQRNCATYARDAWCYYSGEWIDLPPIALACTLEAKAGRSSR